MQLLRAEHITKQYGDKTIIRDISVHLDSGELVSLLGLSGAGKTTLFHVLSGLVTPEEGRVFLEEEDISGKPGRISYMLQKDLLLPHKKIIDNVSLPMLLKGTPKNEAREKADPLFREFGLEGTQYLYPSQLSGGMRQRAALLRTYLTGNRAALLDEPFSALDTITKSQIHEWYLDVIGKIGLSVFFITHDIDEAILLSDRIYIMTGRPGEIHSQIKIETARENRKDFTLTDEFLTYKRRIIKTLREH